MQDFQKLRVWQRAHAFALRVDTFIRQLPRTCPISFKSQLSRAVDSIATNIVEGCGAATQREFARYLEVAIKSTSESEHHLITARDRHYAQASGCEDLMDEASQIRRMLYSLRKRILADLS